MASQSRSCLDLTPGDPAYVILGEQATVQQVKQLHKDLHLDDPVLDRYGRWLDDIVHGDFGTSPLTHLKVSDSITTVVPITAELIVLAFLFALLISVPVGIYTAFGPTGSSTGGGA